MLPASVLVSTATNLRRGDAEDGYNASPTQSDDFSVTVAEDIPCRVTSQSTRQRYRQKLNGIDVDVNTLTIFMNVFDDNGNRWDVQERDRFVVGGRNYDIMNVDNPGQMDHHLELMVQVVK